MRVVGHLTRCTRRLRVSHPVVLIESIGCVPDLRFDFCAVPQDVVERPILEHQYDYMFNWISHRCLPGGEPIRNALPPEVIPYLRVKEAIAVISGADA